GGGGGGRGELRWGGAEEGRGVLEPLQEQRQVRGAAVKSTMRATISPVALRERIVLSAYMRPGRSRSRRPRRRCSRMTPSSDQSWCAQRSASAAVAASTSSSVFTVA